MPEAMDPFCRLAPIDTAALIFGSLTADGFRVTCGNEASHPLKRKTGRCLACVLACCSVLILLFLMVAFPYFDGGQVYGMAGRSVVMACAAAGIASFIWCPRRQFICKLVTLLSLWPVLHLAVETVLALVWRWIDS